MRSWWWQVFIDDSRQSHHTHCVTCRNCSSRRVNVLLSRLLTQRLSVDWERSDETLSPSVRLNVTLCGFECDDLSVILSDERHNKTLTDLHSHLGTDSLSLNPLIVGKCVLRVKALLGSIVMERYTWFHWMKPAHLNNKQLCLNVRISPSHSRGLINLSLHIDDVLQSCL